MFELAPTCRAGLFRIARRVALLFSLIALGVVLTFGASPAHAHTDLIQASPGVGQQVGGDVEFIDMIFGEPVSNVVVTVVGPSGPVTGTVAVDQGLVASYQFDAPLVEEGRYDVAYSMTSFDLDFTEREIFFEYDESAPQPFRIGADGRFIVEPPGRNWLSLLSTILIAVSVVGVALMLIYRQGFFRSSGISSESLDAEADIDSEGAGVVEEVTDESQVIAETAAGEGNPT